MKRSSIFVFLILLVIAGGLYFLFEPSESSDWKTVLDDEQGISYRYPDPFPAEYIHGSTWPPTVEVAIAQFLCAEPLRSVNERKYCVGSESGAAAGSMYTTYTYSTMKDDRMVSVRFALQYPQCANFTEPKKTLCEAERATFNLDELVDRIVESVKLDA